MRSPAFLGQRRDRGAELRGIKFQGRQFRRHRRIELSGSRGADRVRFFGSRNIGGVRFLRARLERIELRLPALEPAVAPKSGGIIPAGDDS